MESDPGWTTEGLWAFGPPAGNGGSKGSPDPTTGYTGSKVYGYNLDGDYGTYLPETHLTTTQIDCSSLAETTLKFWRWLGVEAAFDHAYVRISTDGTNWDTIWQNTGEVADSAWTYQEMNISSFADGQSTVYLRWTMGTTDGSGQYCGWNIDDVEIWSLGSSSPGQITSARSCTTHGLAGELCIGLDTVNIEPRQSGVEKVEFDVSEPASAVNASVVCTPDTYGGTATVTADGGTTVIVEFSPPLPDQNCCEISLSGDTEDTFSVSTLAGDTNLSGDVTAADALATKLYFGFTADAGNATFDYNVSGEITAADYLQLKVNFGHSAPVCP
jgi:hypothetical protein